MIPQKVSFFIVIIIQVWYNVIISITYFQEGGNLIVKFGRKNFKIIQRENGR